MARTALVVLAIIGLFVCTHFPNEFSAASLTNIAIRVDQTANPSAYGRICDILAWPYRRPPGPALHRYQTAGDQPAAPWSIQLSAPGAGSHQTRLALPRWKSTTPLHSL